MILSSTPTMNSTPETCTAADHAAQAAAKSLRFADAVEQQRRLSAETRIVESCDHPADTAAARTHFWVAQQGEHLLGLVGVVEDRPHVAAIHRKRFDRSGLDEAMESKLLAAALTHCRGRGFLKLVLDSVDDVTLIMLHRFAYRHSRTRVLNGRAMVEFYRDLYHQPRK
jgi:hypothetical protein